jgi:hypothetical protein
VTTSEKALLAILGGGAAIFVLGGLFKVRPLKAPQIDPQLSSHRGIAPMYEGTDQVPTRMRSNQDPKGGTADYLGYPYGKSRPAVYAKGEPAQHHGGFYDKREDAAAHIEVSPIDYGAPPVRIPKLWKDGIRYWDGITSHGGVNAVGQSVHLFHLRPSFPTRGYRSVSGSLAKIGGGMSTASRVRVPAIFVPSAVA